MAEECTNNNTTLDLNQIASEYRQSIADLRTAMATVAEKKHSHARCQADLARYEAKELYNLVAKSETERRNMLLAADLPSHTELMVKVRTLEYEINQARVDVRIAEEQCRLNRTLLGIIGAAMPAEIIDEGDDEDDEF